jgi:hypothetical protein
VERVLVDLGFDAAEDPFPDVPVVHAARPSVVRKPSDPGRHSALSLAWRPKHGRS